MAQAIDETGHALLDKVHLLKKNALNLPEVIFQNVTNMAPAAAISYDFPLQAALTAAGAALVLSNVVATVAVLLIANSIIQFAKKLPSAGGYYTYISRGLGKPAGAISGFIFFLYAMVLPAEVTVVWAGITQEVIREHLGVNISWIVWEAIMIAVITWFAYTGVQRSAKLGLVLGSIEVAIFVVLAIGLFIHPVTPVNFRHFLPSSSAAGWGGILGFGMIYGILNFVGFEAAAPLAEETKNPRKNIPRSVLFSALVLGAVYIFVAFAVVPGWGENNLEAFATSPSPFTDMASRLWGPAWIFIYFAMTNSSLACSLASTNSAARVLYSMGRVHFLPGVFGEVHATHKTPHRTILMQGVWTFVLALIVGLLWGTLLGFAVLAVTLTIGAMVIYALGNIALPAFYLKEHRDEFSLIKHILFPAIALVLLVYVLFKAVWPIPAYPMNVPFFAAIVWILVMTVLVIYLAKRNPGALAKSGLLVDLDHDEA